MIWGWGVGTEEIEETGLKPFIITYANCFFFSKHFAMKKVLDPFGEVILTECTADFGSLGKQSLYIS